MNQINIQYFKTVYGELILGSYQQQLCLCDWRYRKMRRQVDKRLQSQLDACYVENSDSTIEQAILELTQYMVGKRQNFTVELCLVGTEFQQSVWRQLQQVEYARVATYSELASELGNLKAIRAVAAANGANALSIIVPCHRIIGSDGKLVGYAGGLETKRKLLNLEQLTAGTGTMTESLALF